MTFADSGATMQAHGDYRIHTAGRLLWIVVSGGINYQFACNYRDAVRVAAQALGPGPWLRVNDIRDWQLGGPEVIPPLRELMQWCEAHELAHSINIVSMVNLQKHMLDQMMAGVARGSQRHLTHGVDDTCQLLRQLLPELDLAPLLAAVYPAR